MKPKALLICAEKEKTEFDGAVRRCLAPWLSGLCPDSLAEAAAIEGYRSDYSLEDAISFRVWGDLTRSGLKGKEATEFVNGGLMSLKTRRCQGRFDIPARNLLDLHIPKAGPIWIAREISRSDLTRERAERGDRRDFYVQTWAGTSDEINYQIQSLNQENAEFNRSTVSTQFYNLSAAVRATRDIAIKLGVLEG